MASTEAIRFAQFNASLNRNSEGQLIADLSTPNNVQARNVAEVIQRVNPDVLVINEFDFVEGGVAATLYQQNYLSVSQNGVDPVEYPYFYVAPSNTGIASGFDLNNNGSVVTTPNTPGYGDDALGFGDFPGQFAMVLYSKYPIVEEGVRTFQNFLWRDMPGALLPDDSNTPEPADWYSPEELDVFRLSSKSHWDVPINVNGTIIHALVSHPTPPTFDGPEDRNGTRNHDEIRFWSDYVTPGQGDYIYDDAGEFGGLTSGPSFVIMGDQNADPFDGDSFDNAILQLLDNPLINTSVTPASVGGPQQAVLQGGANTTHRGDPAFDTADFADTAPGNLRADYVLPSNNLEITDAAVFWPLNDDPLFRLAGVFPFPTSDHRLVRVDVVVPEEVLPPENLILIGGDGDDTLIGGEGDDIIFGGPRNDFLDGRAGDDIAFGEDGSDTAFGGDGNDILFGDQGDDVLAGGAGDDFILGDLGNDLLAGGPGSDVFAFARGDGTDLIFDFSSVEDSIGLAVDLTFEALTIAQGTDASPTSVNSSNNTLLSVTDSGEVLVSLAFVQAETITADNFSLV